MFFSVAYLAFSALKLFLGRRRSEFTKDIELIVLRNQPSCSGGERVALRCGRPIMPFLLRSLECSRGGADRVDRDAADASALALGAGSTQVDAAAA
jgi:hypothetical protein